MAPSIDADINIQYKSHNGIKNTNDSNYPPIIIDGNDDFTSENGVTGGSGTEEDPYIIEGWIIAGNGSSYGIWINNTNLHFVVRNCTIKDFPDKYDSGIYLNHVENGLIENTISFRTQKVIEVHYSAHIEIINCTSDDYSTEWFASGVSCYDTSYIAISKCEFYGKGYGIKLSDAIHCIIDNSSCHHNDFAGIRIGGKKSAYNKIKDCKIYNNQDEGIRLCADDRDRHSTYIHILRCEIYNTGLPDAKGGETGISIWKVHENLIEDCSIHNNGRGIQISTSRGNIIRNCSIFDHYVESGISAEGIQIYNDQVGLFKTQNSIQNCDIYDNEIGIFDFKSLKIKIVRNNLSNNIDFGILSFLSILSNINYNNFYYNGRFELLPISSGVFCWAGFVDVRHNWWGAENGPSYRFHFGDGDEIKRWIGMVIFRPWATEPIPDAGRRYEYNGGI